MDMINLRYTHAIVWRKLERQDAGAALHLCYFSRPFCWPVYQTLDAAPTTFICMGGFHIAKFATSLLMQQARHGTISPEDRHSPNIKTQQCPDLSCAMLRHCVMKITFKIPA